MVWTYSCFFPPHLPGICSEDRQLMKFSLVLYYLDFILIGKNRGENDFYFFFTDAAI